MILAVAAMRTRRPLETPEEELLVVLLDLPPRPQIKLGCVENVHDPKRPLGQYV